MDISQKRKKLQKITIIPLHAADQFLLLLLLAADLQSAAVF